jgi:hypothetical protein
MALRDGATARGARVLKAAWAGIQKNVGVANPGKVLIDFFVEILPQAFALLGYGR